MPKQIDFVKRAEKREKRAARIVSRVQTASPFQTSEQITGLPSHWYGETELKIEREGWLTRKFKMLTHLTSHCQRCADELKH